MILSLPGGGVDGSAGEVLEGTSEGPSVDFIAGGLGGIVAGASSGSIERVLEGTGGTVGAIGEGRWLRAGADVVSI